MMPKLKLFKYFMDSLYVYLLTEALYIYYN